MTTRAMKCSDSSVLAPSPTLFSWGWGRGGGGGGSVAPLHEHSVMTIAVQGTESTNYIISIWLVGCLSAYLPASLSLSLSPPPPHSPSLCPLPLSLSRSLPTHIILVERRRDERTTSLSDSRGAAGSVSIERQSAEPARRSDSETNCTSLDACPTDARKRGHTDFLFARTKLTASLSCFCFTLMQKHRFASFCGTCTQSLEAAELFGKVEKCSALTIAKGHGRRKSQ